MHKGDRPEDGFREGGHPPLEEDPWKVLELNPGAGPLEIEGAYRRLMAVFDPSAPGISALYTLEELQKLRDRVQRAYRQLVARRRGRREKGRPRPQRRKPLPPEEVEAIKGEMDGLGGGALRRIRERMGITLEEVASATKVTRGTLKDIEEERLERLPAWVYLKGFLKAYATFLGLDPAEVIRAFEEKASSQ